jgi:uncharacterized protein YuzE
MKLEFDPVADALYLEISNREVEKSEQIKLGAFLDYDAEGNVVGVEVLSVSKRSKDAAPFKIAA